MNRLPACTAGAVACWPMATDTTEHGLERLIALAGHPCGPPAESAVAEPSAGYGGVASHDIINFPSSPGVDRRSSTVGVVPGTDTRDTRPDPSPMFGR